jgi:hypothetical protein
MKIVNFPDYKQIGASGECPHCFDKSYFRPVATHAQPSWYEPRLRQYLQDIVSACQCESCKGYVLVVGHREHAQQNHGEYFLVAVYPLGKPNEKADESIPPEIREDFKESLRCEWIKAYKACVVMCGRAVQASAMALGAEGNSLVSQIDNLATKGIITEPLKQMAHYVRLTRNVGAHPDKDGLKDVNAKDAADMIEFTREFLHHVYVMPAKLKARFPEPKPQEAKSSEIAQT